MVDIRALQTGETQELTELFGAVLPEFDATSLVDAAGPSRFLDDPSSFALGAYVGETPAGLAWGVQMRYPNGRLVTYLHQLDVREEYRRRGIASALVTAAIGVARRQGSSRFWLSTGAHNEGAVALYASLGGDRKPLGDVNFWWGLD